MELTIFTGKTDGVRFYDSFVDGDGFEPGEYSDCSRFDFSISAEEIENDISEILADVEIFEVCLKGVTRSTLNKFIHKSYNGQIERELITDEIRDKACEIVLVNWRQDCLITVRNKFKGE